MLAADIVISEIMYHPASENPLDEFLEIHNRGDEPAMLGGWAFADGVDYTFGDATLAPGDSLAIAANLARFQSLHPGVTKVVGGWTGELSNSGERIELIDAGGHRVDQVEYADEGDWANRRRGVLDHNHQGWTWEALHDGLGRSLELINVAQGNNNGQNWAASVINGGTPGAANSVAASDIAPIISDVEHSPAIPRSTDPVTIRAEINDELASGFTATLFHRVDGAATFSQSAMFDDGLHNDGAAGDGVFAAILPPQSSSTVVEFFVRALDAANHERTWPAPTDTFGTQGANALYQVDDAFASSDEPLYRLIMTDAERAELAQLANDTFENDSDAQMNATFIATVGADVDVRYNVGQRIRGASSRDYVVKSYRVNIPSDRPWQDVTSININARSVYSQIAGAAVFAASGLPAATATHVQIRVNGADLSLGEGYAHLEVLDGDFVDRQFSTDTGGNLYRKGRPDTKWAFRNGDANRYVQDGWVKGNNGGPNDWTDLNRFLQVINSAPADGAYLTALNEVMDVNYWIRWFAVMTLLDDNETNVSNGTDDDYAMYRGGADARFKILPHDLDSVLGFQGSSTSGSLFRASTEPDVLPQLVRFFQYPEILSRYYAQLDELMTTTFAPERIGPLLDNTLGGLAPQSVINGMKQFAIDRNAYVRTQMPSQLTVNSSLPVTNGYRRTTSNNTALNGLAPVGVTKTVLVNGQPTTFDPVTGSWNTGIPNAISEVLLPSASTWRYNDTGTDLGTAWRASAYSDSTWATGVAQFGYGDGDETTVINGGPEGNHFLTSYFRTAFTVANPSRFTGLIVRLLRDDGAAVYLNGQEILRDNLPAGALFATAASSTTPNSDENRFIEFFVPATALLAGNNVLAVEVHQAGPTSTDFGFDMQLEGLLVQIANTTVVPAGSVWKYLADGSNQGTGWKETAFNDTAWPAGAAQLGYGDGDEVTVIPGGPSNNRFITTYFRRSFTVTGGGQFTNLRLRLLRDDGAAVYLNGVEIARDNLPAGAAFNTVAAQAVNNEAESQYFEFNVNPNLLVEGNNVLAVEIHQNSNTSSDVSFNLELLGQQISDPGGDGGVTLVPGINRVLVQALDAANQEVARSSIDLWYDDATAPVYSGTLTGANIWTAADGPHRIAGQVIIPVGSTLTIQPGATVFFNPGASLVVHGRLTAQGTDTQHIRFTRLPTASGNWNGITLDGAGQVNRLAYVDIDGANAAAWISASSTSLEVDRATFGTATQSVFALTNVSFALRDSKFTDGGDQPVIRATGIPAGSRVSIERNTFPMRTSANALVELESAKRPSPIYQLRDNTFTATAGSTGPAVLLRGADAHIEGNRLRGFAGSAIVARASGAIATEVTLGRNIIAAGGIGVTLLEGSRLESQQNTYADLTGSVVAFAVAGVAQPGAGAKLANDVTWNHAGLFSGQVQDDPTYGTTDLSAKYSVVPAANVALGPGNISGDPLFVDTVDYRLASASPATAAGQQGQDIGAYVPSGAIIGGEPPALTAQNTASLSIGGAGITHYTYRVDGGALGALRAVSEPLVLTGLSNGPHVVQVLGRDSSGTLQPTTKPTVSRTWTVNTALSRVVISEVLAINSSAVTHDGATPDLIELHNDGGAAVDLSGMYLSDDPGLPAKFTFPVGTTLAAGAYLVLYADTATQSPGLHLGFTLNGDADGVYLFDSSLAPVDQVSFGPQIPNLSIGRMSDGTWALATPTFGAANLRQRLGDASSVVLNEWLASADRLLGDDFVELYNPSAQPVALTGLSLTDNLYAEPHAHPIAPLSFIAPGGYAVFLADGNTTAGANHLSFGLSTWHETLALVGADGGTIDVIVSGPQSTDISEGRSPSGDADFGFFRVPSPGLANPSLQSTTEPLLPIDSFWRYDDSGIDRGTAWREPDYNDAFWTTGRGLLYVENEPLPGPKNTPLNLGSTTYYFRSEFDASSIPAAAQAVQLGLMVDDGAIVYLNGQEVLRVGMASGPVSHATLANRDVDEAAAEGPYLLPRALFAPGRNVIAVEVHQQNAGSSDVVFGLTLDAVLPPSDARTTNTLALLDQLRITEMLYNATAGVTTEFIELRNIGATTLDLEGVRFTAGVDYTFPAMSLLPGERIVVAQDIALFEALYGAGVRVVGPFDGSLSNNGEQVKLTLPQPLTGDIFAFTYDDSWYPTTDGGGYSLVVRDPSSQTASLDNAASWRSSFFGGGTPGAEDAGQVVINEVLANTGATDGDWIELRNTTDRDLDLGGWLLSDDAAIPEKYQIPFGTILPAGGFLVFTEQDHFGATGAATPFSLANHGGSIYLVGTDTLGNLNGFVESTSFGAAAVGASFGRHQRSDGQVDFTLLSTPTMGATNAAPAFGPVIVSEVMYHPAAGDEFIELFNTSASALPLHGVANGADYAWQLAGAVSFVFPADATIAAGGRALVVAGDPAAFRSARGVPADVPIYGPYVGDLGDDGDDIRLLMPLTNETEVPLALADRVAYTDDTPWPRGADGIGSTLIRVSTDAYGNDPASWLQGNIGGTPGATNKQLDTTAPSAASGLIATIVNATQIDVSWTAAVDAESGIALYRVFRNGAVIGSSSTTSFSDTGAVAGSTYTYDVAAVNGDTLEGPHSTSSTITTLGISQPGNLDTTHVIVVFSEAVTTATAQSAANYTIGGATVNSATLAADGRTVTLVTSTLQPGRTYSLTVSGVAAASGHPLPSGVARSFVALVAGFTVRDVKSSSTTGPTSLAAAETLLAQPPGSSAILSETTAIVPVIDLTDPDSGYSGRFSANLTFPNQVNGQDDDYFAIRATGSIYIPVSAAGVWTFATRNDDGARLRIDGADVIVDASGHGAVDRFGTLSLSAGYHSVELHYWDGIQNSVLEFFAAPGTFTDFAQTTAWRLVGDTANGGLAVTTSPIVVTSPSVEWQRISPTGGLVFEYRATGTITTSSGFGYRDYEVDLLAGQRLSIVATPAAASQNFFVILRHDDHDIAAAIATTPGDHPALRNFDISAAGKYTIRVAAYQDIAYTLHATLNADLSQDTSGGFVQQVGRRVIGFSSQYGTTSWSAAQALGAPDTLTYGDISTAWAPEPINGTTEFITVGYDAAVYANSAVVRETNGNGFVTRIEALDTVGVYHTVWEGVDTSQPGSPVDFFVQFPQTTYPVVGLRVTIDTDHDLNNWEEIDAIGLLGVQSESVAGNHTPATATSLALSASPLGSVGERSAVRGTVDAGVPDYYRIDAAAGQSLAVVLNGDNDGDVDVAIVDAAGQVLAAGSSVAIDADRSIQGFIAAGGTLYVRVTGDPDTAYTLLVLRDGEFAVEPNNDAPTAVDISRSGVGLGYVGEGASGSGEPGVGGTVSLSQVLTDGESFRWDISQDGSINDGSSDAFDGGVDNQDFTEFSQATLENNNRELTIGPRSLSSGISITRKVYVPSNQGYARFLEIITNNGAAAVNYTVPIYTNLGSDGTSGELITTSSGDATFTTADMWIVTDDQDGSNDPTILHVVAGPGGAAPSTVDATGNGSVAYSYNLALQPGQTRIVMHFVAQSANRAAALAKAGDLVNLEREALSGMTAEELSQVVNFRPSDTADVFAVSASIGNVLSIRTLTPDVGFAAYTAGAPPTGTNSLDPRIELIGPDGSVVAADADSAPDGRNAALQYAVTTEGVYHVRVSAAAGSGDYILQVDGATSSPSPLVVTSTTPGDGTAHQLAAFPDSIIVNFSVGIAPFSIQPGDLTVNGIAAESVEQVDGDSLKFTLPASVNVGERNYFVAIAAGVVTDIAGRTNEAYAGKFLVDATAPFMVRTRFNGQAFPADARFGVGPQAIEIDFSESVSISSQFSIIGLYEINRGVSYFPNSGGLDAIGRNLSTNWPSLAEGQYSLSIYSPGLVDRVGYALDGEPLGSNADGTPTGNGTPDGFYSVAFTVDTDLHDLGALWQRVGAAGTLARSATATGNVTFVGDADAFAANLAAGESLAVRVRPQRPGVFTVRLLDPQGQIVSSSTSPSAGDVVTLPSIVATSAGRYLIEVSGDTAGVDYAIDVTRDAAMETVDSSQFAPLAIGGPSTASGDRWSVVGNSTPVAVGDYEQTHTVVGAIRFPNQLSYRFTDVGRPRGDAVVDVSAMAYLASTQAYLSVYAEGYFLANVFVADGGSYDVVSNTSFTIPEALLSKLAADGVVELRVEPSQNVFDVFSESFVSLTLKYPTANRVWGVRPTQNDIVLIDAESGAILRSLPAPAGLAPNHTRIGLTAAEGGSSLLYINSDADPHTIYRLNPATGAVMSTSTVAGEGYDGLGFDGNATIATIYSANMDTNPGWSLTGQWAYGVPTGQGTNNHDPTSGFTGANVIGYNLNGNYANSLSSTFYATTPAIDARGVTGTTLSFYRWLGIESCCDDVNIQVSNNGTNWVTIWQNAEEIEFDPGWALQSYDISAVADNQQTVYVRWGLGPTDGSVVYGGWNIDDVKISGKTPVDSKVFLGQRDVQLVRQEGLGGAVTANWGPAGAPRGGVGGDDTGRIFAYYGDGLIHEVNPDSDSPTFVGNPITPPAADVEGLAFDGGLLYVSTASGKLYALDPSDGHVVSNVNVAGGGLFGLAAGASIGNVAPFAMVPQGSVWKYFDRGQDLGTAWRESNYEDASWSQGPGRLGYSPNREDGEVTTVSYGPTASNKYPTTYFRRHFNVADPASILALQMEIVRDDGAAVYLNGVEIARTNLAADASYSTYAPVAETTSEQQFFAFNVDPSLLVAGDNVLAVEVHQASAASTDLGFDLRMTAQPKPVAAPDVDAFSLDLTGRAGQRLDITLSDVAGGTNLALATLELLDPSGEDVLATATATTGASANYVAGIRGFVVPASGVYMLRVRSFSSTQYAVSVSAGMTFDTEPNNSPPQPLVSLDATRVAAGFLAAGTDAIDQYTLTLTAGDRVRISTETPLSDVGVTALNTLNPRLNLFAPNGAQVASRADSAQFDANPTLDFVAAATGVYRIAVSAESNSGEYRMLVESLPLASFGVADVAIADSHWNSQFLARANPAAGARGYSILSSGQASGASPTSLPWNGLDRVSVKFTGPANVAANDLTIDGVAQEHYAFTNFHYDPVSFIATWTLAAAVPLDNLLLVLSDRVTSDTNVPLDGNADGRQGGMFIRRFGVLPGDVNGDRVADSTDATAIHSHFAASPDDPAYAVLADLNGSTTVDDADLAFVTGAPRTAPAETPALMPILGDLTRDGAVNVADLLALRSRFDMQGALSVLDGDLNADGAVDRADLVALMANFGHAAPAAAPSTLVVAAQPTSSGAQRSAAADRAIANIASTRIRAARRDAVRHETTSLAATATALRARRATARSAGAGNAAHDVALSAIMSRR